MPSTQRMGIPYPSDGQEDAFDIIVDMVDSMDGHHFAAFEDRNLFVSGGGDWTWNSGTGSVTWDATLRLNTPNTGIAQDLAASSAILVDGDMLVIDISRGATSTVTLVAAVDNALEPDDAVLALAFSYGGKLYFRNGVVLTHGTTYAVFEEGAISARPNDQEDVFVAIASQTTFAMSGTPDANSVVKVYVLGVLQWNDAGGDYTIVGTDVIFNTAVTTGFRVIIHYWT